MAETSMHWPGNVAHGDPGDVGPYSAAQFANFLFYAAFDQQNGVLSGLAVVASSPTGKNVAVLAGDATIRGYFYDLDADTTLNIADNVSGNDRIDRIILRCDWTAQEVRLVVLEGTPAVSPSAPTLTQTPGTLYEISLAQIAVANGFSALTDAEITRERAWARQNPPGKFQPSLRLNVPEGWIVCDGSEVSRTSYRDLFDAIGTSFGVGDGSTTFNLPDLRGKTFAGLDNMGGTSANVITDSSADTLGGTMGEETHTLTVAEIPAHTHDWGAMSPNFSGGANSAVVNASNNYASSSAGGDQPHNNVQPTTFGNWIIKT